MRGTGLGAVLAVALALGGGVLWLRGASRPSMKLPGPCEVTRELRYPAGPNGERPPEPVSERTVLRYDDEGRPVLEQRMLDTLVQESVRWSYDDAGNRVLEERHAPGPIHHTDADGTQRVLEQRLSRVRWTYDDAGRMLTRAVERDGDGVVQQVIRFEYDAQGRKAKTHVEWDGEHRSTRVFEYDAQGRLVGERSDGDATEHVRYEHDAAGRAVRQIADANADGTPDRTTEHVYDEHGWPVQETLHERNIGVRTTTYTHDDHGNVLTRHELAREGEGDDVSGVEVLDRYDYRCWTVRDGRAVDERPALP